MDQTQTPRYVLRFEHPALRPRLHTEGFSLSSTQDFPHREPPLRIWANAIWEYTTPLSTVNNTTSTLRGKVQSQIRSTSQLRDRHLAKQSTSHQRDTQSPLSQSPLTKGISTQSPLTRGISQSMEGLQLDDLKDHKPIFSHKIKILQIGQINKLKCEKIKSLEIKNIKKNSWENFQDIMEMKNKNQSQRLLLFLDFSNPFKSK